MDAEFFANVVTSDLESLGLKPHPDRVAEAASLSAVTPPMDKPYKLMLPPHVVKGRVLEQKLQALEETAG